MKAKWTISVLSLVSLVITACGTTNQNSTAPVDKPQIQPPVTSPSPTLPTQVVKPNPQTPSPSEIPSPGQTAQPKPTQITAAKTAEVRVEGLNVRSAPNTNSQVRGTLPKGTQAKIIQSQGNWYYIVMGRVEGWVSGSYIKILEGNPGSAR